MNYLIDGYNLLFLFPSKDPLQKQRDAMVEKIQKAFALKKLQGIVVFDGAQIGGKTENYAYAAPLEIVFTDAKKSADEWIVEKIERSKKKDVFVVVTDDGGIKRNVKNLGAQVISREEFLIFLFKTKIVTNALKDPIKESPRSFERLLKIFTERLEKGLDDD